MALYVPAGARTRRLVIVGIAALVIGLILGFGAGRASSPDLADEVGEVQDVALAAVTAVQRIPIEYEQVVAGAGGESADNVTAAIASARTQLDTAYTQAIWLSEDASTTTDERFDALVSLVEDGASAAQFEAGVDDLVEQIESAFAVAGVPTD